MLHPLTVTCPSQFFDLMTSLPDRRRISFITRLKLLLSRGPVTLSNDTPPSLSSFTWQYTDGVSRGAIAGGLCSNPSGTWDIHT